MDSPEKLCLYAVRNREGKWFRRKGYGGYGETWVDDFARARIYTRPGGARGVIGWFANHHPTYGVPDLVALNITSVDVLDEKTRIEERKKKREAAEAKRQVRDHAREVKEAKRKLAEAEAEFERLSGHPKMGTCDGCMKEKPWDELENTRMGPRIMMCLCKECRSA